MLPGAQRIFFDLFPVEAPVGNSQFFVGGRRDHHLIEIALVIESGGADKLFIVWVDDHRLGECRQMGDERFFAEFGEINVSDKRGVGRGEFDEFGKGMIRQKNVNAQFVSENYGNNNCRQ